ncbi:Hypothetical protein, putative [Bodo saltans]|uniref:Uncharacterized protein n=1 Tax=Bodo saltans TaxID=75058 RepID=A0A0S4JE37_BODSA|nr:Hypothetical protein, putative [Bodo saltans]|eukprot:CUG89740.1 Hypothetical protein, putative [Bodo saltans]
MSLRQIHRLVPITHSAGEEGREVLVTEVSVLLTVFSHSCMWIHVTNSHDARVQGESKSLPPFGCASVATPLAFPPFVSETLLLESPILQPLVQQEAETVGTSVVAPQTSFAQSLATRLTRRYRNHQHADVSQPGIVFTICCGIHGDLEAALVGTMTGGASRTVLEFGGIVFKQVAALVDEVLSSTTNPSP